MARAATGATANQKFGLITDIGVAQGEWLKFPSSVHAPSPIDRNVLCRLRISHNIPARRRAPDGDNLPSIYGASSLEIRRPCPELALEMIRFQAL
jgi:hypothetical protein